MSTRVKEAHGASEAPVIATELYTPEEQAIVDHIKNTFLSGGNPFEHGVLTASEIADKKILTPEVIASREKIVFEVQRIINHILADRNKPKRNWDFNYFNAYVDAHFGEEGYEFLGEKILGINVNGWGLFTGFLKPMESGIKIGPDVASTRPANWKSGR